MYEAINNGRFIILYKNLTISHSLYSHSKGAGKFNKKRQKTYLYTKKLGGKVEIMVC